MPEPICTGLNVVEVGAGSVPASLAGMILADNGARVVKVEPPAGDPLRASAPSGALVWNRGKESVVADLRHAGGRAQVRDLARDADVVLLGLAPDRIERWGLDHDELATDNAGLVTTSITGFGRSGAYARLKGYEGVVAAKVGLFGRGMFGVDADPVFSPNMVASSGAAQLAVSATLAALIVRERTGRGQRVDTSLVQGLIAADYFGIYHVQLAKRAAAAGAASGATATAPGGGMAASRYSLCLCTRDGRWVSLSPQQPHQAHALLRAIDLAHTLDEERFSHAPFFRTAEDAQEWEDLLWEKFRARTYAELEPAMLAQGDLPFELCRSSEEALDHPQIIANGEVVEVDDPVVGRVREVGPVATFHGAPSVIARSAPRVGDHGAAPARRATPTGHDDPPAHALSGVTIVEFGYFYAMPFGVTLAASLGARVIKLEDAAGDPMRMAFGGDAGSAKVMEGKESLSIDLKSAEGRAIVHQLIERADAFVIGFRPGVAERLGIDYESLRAINPKLVYVHAAGYGVEGPYAARPVYASTALSLAGSVNRHAGAWMDPARSEGLGVAELQAVIAPHLRGPVDGDSNAALAACTALLFGLAHQRRTGEGQFVSTSMIGGNVYAYTDDAVTYAGKPPVAQPDLEHRGLGALYRMYRASDAWVFLAAPRESEWAALLDVVADDALRAATFATAADRRTHDDALTGVLQGIFPGRTAAEWESALSEAGVGCAAVFASEFQMGSHPAFVAEDPVMFETGMSADIEHPLFGTIRRHGVPAHLSETPGRVAPGCLRGQHTRSILAELGYAPDEIEKLEANNVVFGPD